MTTFPTALDAFTNPGPSQAMDTPGLEHDVQHANLNDAVKELQKKVGVDNSAVTTSLDYKIRQLEGRVANPDANLRFKDGQLQFWDEAAAAADPSKPWRALGCHNGQTTWSAPISN